MRSPALLSTLIFGVRLRRTVFVVAMICFLAMSARYGAAESQEGGERLDGLGSGGKRPYSR
jgi:hypothetical protein